MIPKFLKYLQRTDLPKLQFEAAWCLTNVASGTNEHVAALLHNGTLLAFVQLLQSPYQEIVEQAVWGLGNIAGDSSAVRD